MAVTRYQLKKWFRKYILRTQKSFRQGIGTVYSRDEVKGYYNDLREKVTDTPLPDGQLPKSYTVSGEQVYFSIGIFQYGLGAYDLYLLSGDEKMKARMLLCASWALENQRENGAWDTFANLYPERPYSAMAQGEGVSLLVRAYLESGEQKYLESARRAVYFMLVPIEEGGVSIHDGKDLIFKEYTERPVVLNGWIFALWGLFDYVKATGDKTIAAAYEGSLATLKRHIPHYDLGYWTRYDASQRIAAPAYHKLHMDQLAVLYDLTEHEIFKTYLEKIPKLSKEFLVQEPCICHQGLPEAEGKISA